MRLFELLNAILAEPAQKRELSEVAYSPNSVTKLITSADKPRTPNDIEQLINRAKSDPDFTA